MTIYEENIKLLEKISPELLSILKTENDNLDLKLLKINNSNNLRIANKEANCFLNSIYNIDEEMTLMFSNIDTNVKLLFLMGVGSKGCVFDYLKKHYKNLKRIVIIEPSLEIFRFFMQTCLFNEKIKGLPAITFLVNKDSESVGNYLSEIVYQEKISYFPFVILSSYRVLFNEYYNATQQQLLKMLRRKKTVLLTRAGINLLVMKNALVNFQLDFMTSDHLNSLFADKPVTIVSAGPSLNKHLPLLKQLKKKSFLIAVGSAITVLQKNGIQPHFRAALDWSEIEKDRIFSGDIMTEDIPLIYSNNLYSGIGQHYIGKKILMILDTDYVGQYFYDKLEISYTLIPSGASIANVIFGLLCYSTCQKIILLGQDMCYYEEDNIYASGRNLSEEEKREYKDNIILQKDIYGKEVYTIIQMLNMKYDFEDLIKKLPKKEVINASEAGLGIEGISNKKLLEVMEQLPDIIMENEKNNLELLWQRNKGIDLKKKEKMLWDIAEEIKNIKLINNKRMDFIRHINKKRNKKVKNRNILNDITYLKSMEQQLNNYDLYSRVMKVSLNAQWEVLKLKLRNENDEIESAIQINSNICIELEKQLRLFTLYLMKVLNINENLEKVN